MKNAFWRCGVVLAAAAMVLAGCVATTPFQRVAPPDGKAMVYLFRPESMLSRGTMVNVTINAEDRGMLVNNGYLPIQVDPGLVEIRLLTADFIKNEYDAMTIDGAAAGEAYFVKAKPGVLGAFTLVRLDADAGMAEISKTQRYQTK